MDEHDRPSRSLGRRRGLESVVGLYLSRARKPPGAPDPRGGEEAITDHEDPGRSDPVAGGLEAADSSVDAPAARRPPTHNAQPAELPPLESSDESEDAVEGSLPPLRIGAVADRAEAAFRIEESLARYEQSRPPPESAAPAPGSPARSQTGAEAVFPPVPPIASEIEIVFQEEAEPAPEPPAGDSPLPGADASRRPMLVQGPRTMGETATVGEHPEPMQQPLARAGPAPSPTAREEFPPSQIASAPPSLREAEPPQGVEEPVARVALLLGAAPVRLRRSLLEIMADPLLSDGRGVLILESGPPSRDAGAILQEALEQGTPLVRRSLGLSPRDILLLSPAERRFLFAGLAADEKRSDLVAIDLELPESILCPRLQFLVDTIVLALTSQESSLYEAYRSLRGLPDRRPEIEPFTVCFARSEGEARLQFERFETIAKEFLKLKVVDGGWVEIPAGSAGTPQPAEILLAPRGALSTALRETLATPPRRGEFQRSFLGERDRAFFEHLGDWFGPFVAS